MKIKTAMILWPLFFATYAQASETPVSAAPAASPTSPTSPRYVKTVSFVKATADIAEMPDIDRIVAWAKKNPTSLGRVEGYNCPADLKDRKPDDEKTKLLLLSMAERRAKVVLAALVEKGLDKSRLSTVPLGMAEDGEACKAQVVFSK